MKALVWSGDHIFKVEDVQEPKIEPNRIIVKVEACAICGSDFHMDDFGTKPPLVLGHEVSGTVMEIGEGVKGFSLGNRVVLNPVQSCGVCLCCTHGIEHLCDNARHLGAQSIPGGWAEYVIVDAANAYHIPDNIDFVSACLTEPLAVCYESFQRAGLCQGDNVLIIGDGPFGFLHAQVAQTRGAGKIIVAGHYDQRLARIAAHTGAVICNTHYQNLQEVLIAETGSLGVDIVIEATGVGESLNMGLNALRPRGTLIIFSYIWNPEVTDLAQIHMRELNVLGACRSQNTFQPCLDLMSKGKLNMSVLVDLQVPLDDYQSGMERLRQQKEKTFKVVLLPQV